MNGNHCIEFYLPTWRNIVKFWLTYSLLQCASMSPVLLVAMNFFSSFSAEMEKNGEIEEQYTFARLAICAPLCKLICEINCSKLRSLGL